MWSFNLPPIDKSHPCKKDCKDRCVGCKIGCYKLLEYNLFDKKQHTKKRFEYMASEETKMSCKGERGRAYTNRRKSTIEWLRSGNTEHIEHCSSY